MMRILIVAGEKSGFVLADLISAEVKKLNNQIEVYYLNPGAATGEVFGFSLGLLPKLLQSRRLIDRLFISALDSRPDLAVLIAFPGINLLLGRRLRAAGVPTIVVAPPQFWAWGAWRIRLLRAAADRVVCLFDFEAKLLRRNGVPAFYFGYPFFDAVKLQLTRRQVYEQLGMDDHEEYIVLLPGTRSEEIAFHQPLFCRVFELLKRRFPGLRGVIVGGRGDRFPSGIVQTGDQNRYDIYVHARAALAVSGTVTAELAILGVPMAVSYRLAPVSRFLCGLMVRIPYFALPNIITGERVVPEYLNPSPERLSSVLAHLLDDKSYRQTMIAKLGNVKERLGPAGATEQIARLIFRLGATRRTGGVV